MEQYIKKSTLVAEIEKLLRKDKYSTEYVNGKKYALKKILSIIDTLKVKEVEEGSLEKFKSLQHITRDLKRTLQDWGYAPNLYFCDEMWHVSWISCEEGDSIKDFEGNTPEEAIDKAYNWFHSTFCNS